MVDLARARETWERMQGTVINWKAPGSISLNPEIGARFAGPDGIVLEIYGAKGKYINPVSKFAGSIDDEWEAILMPGSRFRVGKVFTGKYDTKFGIRERTTVILYALP
jgi:hypothetical protein